jgi:hypothetical protein
MNSKHPLHKEKLKVQREIDELWKIQRNQNWIELETPYISGYYNIFDLRDDIKNRDDAWVFYECISLVANRVWWKDKSFKRKISKGKYEYIAPGFGEISEETYAKLHPAVKKYFRVVSIWSRKWSPFRNIYECHVPSYFFVTKTEPRWITHYKEFDSVIARQEAEKEDYLDSRKFWSVHCWRGYSTAPKDYCQSYNRSDRAHNKQALSKNIRNGGDFDKYEYRYKHRHSASWDYW